MPPDKLTSRTASKGGPKLIDMGDGRIVEFPATMSDEQIENALRSQQPTQFEQEKSDGRGFWGTLADKASSAWQSVSGGPTGGNYDPTTKEFWIGKGPQFTTPPMIKQATRPLPEGRNTLAYRTATTLSPLVPGLDPEGMERAANRGDTGGVAAETAIPVAALAGGELAGRVIAPGARSLASRIETPAKINLPGGFKFRVRNEPPTPFAPDFVERDATKLNTEFAGEERPSAPFERDATKLNEPYAGEAPETGWHSPLSSRIQTPKPLFEPVSSSPNQANQRWLAEQGQPIPVSQSPNIAAAKWQTEQLGTQESPAGWSSPLSSRIKPSPVRTSLFGPTSTSTSSPALAPGGPLPQPGAPAQPFLLRVAERAGKAAKASPSAPEGVSGSVAKPNDRLVLLPEEAQAESQMRQLAGRRASERGTYYAGEMRPPGTTGPGAKPVNRVPRQSTPTETPFQPPLSARVAGETVPLKTETDSLGVRWAIHPETGYRVSIPKSVPDEGIEAYARQKLAEQQQIHQQLTGGQQ